MHCLTWHGTVLRLDRTTGQMIHALPWPLRTFADDWSIDVPETGVYERTQSAADPALMIHPAGDGSLVHMQRGGSFLCAGARAAVVSFDRPQPNIWETFFLLTAEDLARLRRLLCGIWKTELDVGGQIPHMVEGFRIRIGKHMIDLRQGVPGPDGEGGEFTDHASGARFTLQAVQVPPVEISLARRREDYQVPLAANEAEFRHRPDSRLSLPGTPEYGFLPLAACRADEDWLQERWSQPGGRSLGRHRLACQVVRERDKYVLLGREWEGIIFDDAGASNEAGFLYTNVSLNADDIIRREGDRVFIDAAALDTAPRIEGPCAVFYNAHLSNYYHWIIDGFLPLHAMAPHLPAGTRLLIPGTIAAFRRNPELAARTVDHMAALHAWGYGDWPTITIDAPVCHVEEVYWVNHGSINEMPADIVRLARDAAVRYLPPPAPERSRIYVKRGGSRGVANSAQLEQVLANNGFATYEMEGLAPREQMQLFRNAAIIVSPHGAALANLLFCAPGTKVIELSPDCEFRTWFAHVSDKLDLAHAVLPCPTHNGGFFGNMTVNMDKFRAVLRMMLFRL